jgi:hypothetical protein
VMRVAAVPGTPSARRRMASRAMNRRLMLLGL